MINVLVVDDEKLVRIAMRNIVDWESLGAKVLGYVKDGSEALEILENNRVDLVISDLKMPVMDGITLIKEIRKRKIDTNIVVLSNHGDFDLVREAMKNGAFDYLLKLTIEGEVIEEVLKQIKQMNVEKVIAKESSEEKKTKEEINFKNIIDDDNKYINSFFRIKSKENTSNLKKIHLNIENIVDESIASKVQCEIIWTSDLDGVILLTYDENINYKNILMRVSKNIKQYLDFRIKFVLSDVIDRKDINKVIENSKEILDKDFYEKEEIFILSDNIKHKKYDYSKNKFHLEIFKEAKQKNISRMMDILVDALSFMREELIDESEIKNFVRFIFTNIKGQIVTNSNEDFGRIDDFLVKVDKAQTYNELLFVINDSKEEVGIWFNNQSKRYRKEVEDVISYINENLSNKITLGMLARDVCMNESYLSRIFKSETGKNLMYYINEVKMDRALELLRDKNIMVKEVSAMVGIDDQFYFNKLFKKFYSISPSDFRKKTYK